RLVPDVVVLVFDAENCVDERAPVNQVIETAAGIPAAFARRAVFARSWSVAPAGHARAISPFEIGRCPAAGRKDHPAVPGVTEPRARGEQVGDFVLAERIEEARAFRKRAAGAAALAEAAA